MICTPPRTHAALIERAARAGKAIFCEKPVDLDLARVEACAKVLAETHVPFFVAFNRRFDPSHRALAEAIRTPRYGWRRPARCRKVDRAPRNGPLELPMKSSQNRSQHFLSSLKAKSAEAAP